MEIRIVGTRTEVNAMTALLTLLSNLNDGVIAFTYDGKLVPRRNEDRVSAYLNNVTIRERGSHATT